jgi:hypothetical protein
MVAYSLGRHLVFSRPASALACALFVIGIAASTAGASDIAGSTALDRNLVRNAGAELGKPPASINDATKVPYWKTTNQFTQLNYGRQGYPTKAESAKIGGQKQFFTGGYIGGKASATQLIALTGLEDQTDAGALSIRLSVYIATYTNQTDFGHADVAFVNERGKVIGHLKTPEVTKTNGKFILKTSTQTLPKGTRSLRVSLIGRNTVEAEYIDTYFDNVVVCLHAS